MPATLSGEIVEKSPAPLLMKVTDVNSGALILRANLNAISYEVWTMKCKKVTAETPVDINATVYDVLQLGQGWTLDKIGFNFAVTIPAGSFPADGVYRVVFKFVPTAGAPWFVPWRLKAAANPFGNPEGEC